MSTPFTLLGDPDAGVCVDGLCVVPTRDVARSGGSRTPEAVDSVHQVTEDLEIRAFTTTEQLWSWLTDHHERHPGLWVRLQKVGSTEPSVTFQDLLEAGIAFGWSESTRRGLDDRSYLQKFTPRRNRGTASPRNREIADRLETEGRMTAEGRRALGG